MDLVEEQDDPGLARLGHELRDALLELAAVLGSRGDGGERDLDDPGPAERRRHLARHDPLSEPLHDGGLADAGRPEQHRVALRRTDEDLDHPGRLVLPPDDGRELTERREMREVATDRVEQRGGLGVLACLAG